MHRLHRLHTKQTPLKAIKFYAGSKILALQPSQINSVSPEFIPLFLLQYKTPLFPMEVRAWSIKKRAFQPSQGSPYVFHRKQRLSISIGNYAYLFILNSALKPPEVLEYG